MTNSYAIQKVRLGTSPRTIDKHCRFEKGHKVTIHKNMSWAKMLYTQLLQLPFCMGSFMKIQHCGIGKHSFVDICFLSMVPIGLVTFVISLHLGGKFGVLDIDGTDKTNSERGDVVELADINGMETQF